MKMLAVIFKLKSHFQLSRTI